MTTKRERIAALEDQQVELGERTDPMDLFTTISIIADAEDDIRFFLETHLYRDLLRATQSNPDQAHAAILKMIELDEKIAEIDDEEGD